MQIGDFGMSRQIIMASSAEGENWAWSVPSALRTAAYRGVSPLVAAMFRVKAKP